MQAEEKLFHLDKPPIKRAITLLLDRTFSYLTLQIMSARYMYREGGGQLPGQSL